MRHRWPRRGIPSRHERTVRHMPADEYLRMSLAEPVDALVSHLTPAPCAARRSTPPAGAHSRGSRPAGGQEGGEGHQARGRRDLAPLAALPWLISLEAVRPGFLSPPRETRTPTPLTQDKALNLVTRMIVSSECGGFAHWSRAHGRCGLAGWNVCCHGVVGSGPSLMRIGADRRRIGAAHADGPPEPPDPVWGLNPWTAARRAPCGARRREAGRSARGSPPAARPARADSRGPRRQRAHGGRVLPLTARREDQVSRRARRSSPPERSRCASGPMPRGS